MKKGTAKIHGAKIDVTNAQCCLGTGVAGPRGEGRIKDSTKHHASGIAGYIGLCWKKKGRPQERGPK